MKKEYSLGKVQLLFPTQSLDNQMLNILRKGMPMPGISVPLKKPTAEVEMKVKAEPFKEEISKINILGINFGTLMNAFKGLKVEQIELWIEAAAEVGGILSIALSAKGEGGIKVVLKPED